MKNLMIILFLFIASISFGQDSPQILIDSFFETYKTDASKAVKDLYKTSKWFDRIQDDIESIANTLNGFNVDYMGEYYGYELITKKGFSESFKLYSYLIKYDRQPIRFTFKFYKPNDKWILYSFKYDDGIDDEIEESAKLYYLDMTK